MRYTPIIDISEQPILYKNLNIRLVYLHMVLKSGYHNYDRDIYNISIRNLANEVGISVSAVRHALDMLQKAKMIVRKDGVYYVRKWVVQQDITPRARTERQQKAQQEAQERIEDEKKRKTEYKREEQRREELRRQGKTEYMLYYESMMQRAENGDVDAQTIVRRNKAVYEAHKAKIEEENNHQ